MNSILPRVIACLLLAGIQNSAADPTVGATTVLGPFTGHDAPLHPANMSPLKIAYYGTDLGWSYQHDGQLHFLFGDTAATEKGEPIEASSKGLYDDSFGTIELADWPDPSLITPGNVPRLRLGQNAGTTEVSAINLGRPMESFKTPLGGFSNGRREYGLFYFSKQQACRADADCGNGFACDAGLGFVGERPDADTGLTVACVDGAPGCNADTLNDGDGKPVAGSGFCVDTSSSVWADSGVGRTSSVAVKNLAGLRSTEDPRRYTDIKEWLTNKFSNVTPRTVQDFVPARGTREQDYRIAGDTGENRRVFLWGRPGFIGVKATGRSLGLYFAYADMPVGDRLDWTPHYYAGSDAKGVPQFSDNERDAVAVDLDSTQQGIQPVEQYDIVDQMTLTWVGPLKKWVMLYGGGLINLTSPVLPTCGLLEFFAGSECKAIDLGNGAIRMRSADNPWGPWSPPQDVLVGGDPARNPPEQQFAPGGILHHPDCVQVGCADSTDWDGVNPREYGFLYGVNIIEQWTRPAGSGVDLIWNVSTWDPYRVVLLRTRINR
ncbi:MAG: hypothetical protein WBO00_04825 [Steroidobacteraceae bacterium]